MDKLVDTAVGLVEEGRLQQAVEVLQQGITLLTATYPGRCAGSGNCNSLAVLIPRQALFYATVFSCWHARPLPTMHVELL
jgi:hypothetical protein